MKFTRMVEQEVDVALLKVSAEVRYWEDAEVNGVEDSNGTRMPFVFGETWKPEISLDTGRIVNWPKGTTADIHYKVCDAGVYSLVDFSGNVVAEYGGYVPDMLAPGGDGYGDYIIMKVDGSGQIEGWKANLIPFRIPGED